MACQWGHLNVVEWLENHNIPRSEYSRTGITSRIINPGDIHHVIEHSGRTPVFIASFNNHVPILQWFDARGLFIETVRIKSNQKFFTSFRFIRTYSWSSKCSCVFMHLGRKGSTPLYVACQNGHEAVVDFILARDQTQVSSTSS